MFKGKLKAFLPLILSVAMTMQSVPLDVYAAQTDISEIESVEEISDSISLEDESSEEIVEVIEETSEDISDEIITEQIDDVDASVDDADTGNEMLTGDVADEVECTIINNVGDGIEFYTDQYGFTKLDVPDDAAGVDIPVGWLYIKIDRAKISDNKIICSTFEGASYYPESKHYIYASDMNEYNAIGDVRGDSHIKITLDYVDVVSKTVPFENQCPEVIKICDADDTSKVYDDEFTVATPVHKYYVDVVGTPQKGNYCLQYYGKKGEPVVATGLNKSSSGFTQQTLSDGEYNQIASAKLIYAPLPYEGKKITLDDQTTDGDFKLYNDYACTEESDGEFQDTIIFLNAGKAVKTGKLYCYYINSDNVNNRNYITDRTSVTLYHSLFSNGDVLHIRDCGEYSVTFDEDELSDIVNVYSSSIFTDDNKLSSGAKITEGSTIYLVPDDNIAENRTYNINGRLINSDTLYEALPVTMDTYISIQSIFARAKLELEGDAATYVNVYANNPDWYGGVPVDADYYFTEGSNIYVTAKESFVDGKYLELSLKSVFDDGEEIISDRSLASTGYASFHIPYGKNRKGDAQQYLDRLTLSGKFVNNPTLTIVNKASSSDFKFYNDKECTKEIKSGDSVVPNTSVYVKNTSETNRYVVKREYDDEDEAYTDENIAFEKAISYATHMGFDDVTLTVEDAPTFNVEFDAKLASPNKVRLEIDGKRVTDFSKPYVARKGDSVVVNADDFDDKDCVKIKGTRYDEDGYIETFCNYYLTKERGIDLVEYDGVSSDIKFYFSDVAMRKVTIIKPENYNISAYCAENFGDWDWRYFEENENGQLTAVIPARAEVTLDFGEVYDDIDYYLRNPLAINVEDATGKRVEGYLGYESEWGSYFSFDISDSDTVVNLVPTKAYKLQYDSDEFRLSDWSKSGFFHEYECEYDDGEDWYYTYREDFYAIPGSTITLKDDELSLAKNLSVKVTDLETGKKKVIEDKVLTKDDNAIRFTMPEFDVNVESELKDTPKHVLTIDTSKLSDKSKVSTFAMDENDSFNRVKSGDALYENELIHMYADSVADNKKMVVSVTKTGTNEIATGGAKGVTLEGVRKLLLRMLGFDTTLSVKETDRVGTGNKVYITESVYAENDITYSVIPAEGDEYEIGSGDLAPEGSVVKINVNKIKNGSRLAFNVICPNENMLASGSKATKPILSKQITSTGSISFQMPAHTVEILARESGEAIDIASATITLEKNNYEFTAKEIEPVVTSVKLADGTILVQDADFKVECSNNINVGQATLTIKGMGNFGGSASTSFNITGRALSDEAISVEVPQSVTYVRKREYKVKPVVAVNGVVAVEDRDYKLEYSNNDDVTENAIVNVVGLGNLTGTMGYTFKIVKPATGESGKLSIKSAIIKADSEKFVYTGSEIKPEYTVTYENVPLLENVDYTVTYINNKNAGDAKAIIKGMGMFESSEIKNFEIAPRDFDDEEFVATAENMKYKKTAKKYEPKVFVQYAGETLNNGLDYKISYLKNDGKTEDAMVVLTGKHNYTGQRIVNFKILKESIAGTKLSVKLKETKFDYTGEEIRPEIESVKYQGNDMKLGEDYEVVYKNNTNAGKGEVVIVGMGEFTGSKSIKFTISPIAFNKDDFTVAVEDQIFNGNCRPLPVVTNNKTGEVLPDMYYTLSYKNNKIVSTDKKKAAVVVKACKNYKGSVTANFEIKPIKMDEYDWTIEDCSYTGAAIKPNIVATSKVANDVVISVITTNAFKATFKDNKEIGVGSVVIKPKKNTFVDFCGLEEKSINFNIVKADLELATVKEIAAQKYKNGKEVKPSITLYIGDAKLNNRKAKIEVAYDNNKEKGIATATITSTDTEHFSGSKTVQFAIK